jgi:PAS domain S-box-containing protein
MQAAAVLHEQREWFRTTLGSIGDAVIATDAQGRVKFLNGVAQSLTGWTDKDSIDKPLAEVFHIINEKGRERCTDPVAKVLRSGAVVGLANHTALIGKDGTERSIADSAAPICSEDGKVSGVVLVFRDVTEQRRGEEQLRLNEARLQALVQLNQMSRASLQEITDFALESAVALTGSTIGYLAFMNEDETVLTMHSWSKTAMQECAIIDKPIVYPVVTTGLWGEAVRQRKPVFTNDYQGPNPLKKGYPEGHVKVLRHMNAPIFDGDRIVIVAGVGNKAAPYDDSDVRQLTLLMQGMWQLLQRRHSQERLAHLNAVLRAVRSVNQLISREKQRDRLLEGACRCLVEARGYQQAWAFLRDGSDVPGIWTEAGVGESWPLLVERMRQGEVPPCIREAFDRPGLAIAEELHCNAEVCTASLP